MPWILFLLLISAGGSCVPGVPPSEPSADFRLPPLHAELDPVEGGRIVDAHGREVLLRGVNFSSFGEYWAYDPNLPTTHPFTPADADTMAGIGWNLARMIFSWSRVEPEPGVYDEAYLDELEAAVQVLQSRGIYTLLDAHQDAWGPSLAWNGEDCLGVPEAFGWDGAPEWATLDGGAPRCAIMGTRELSAAVRASFDAFWADAPGPGGVGIQTRYARMWARVVERLSKYDAVVGYDVMNEPNAMFEDPQIELTRFYEKTLAEIRAAEQRVGSPRRLFFFEPSILWNDFRFGAPLPFGDDQMVYAPHLYFEGVVQRPLDATTFEQARAEAATFGGIPVVTGEWGANPMRASDPDDDFFDRHQAFQDEYHFGATIWSWHTACGDPHLASAVRDGVDRFPWGFFDDNCEGDAPRGMREDLVRAMRRPLVRAAPGKLTEVLWDRPSRSVTVRGEDAERGSSVIVFYPLRPGDDIRHAALGLHAVRERPAMGGGVYLVGHAEGGDWELVVELR